MIKGLYLIISHEADFESCTHSVIGACKALDLAVAKLREHIAVTFEAIKSGGKMKRMKMPSMSSIKSG